MEIVLKDDVEYILREYETEDEFEKIIFDNYKNIFGKDTIFLPKQKIKTKSGVGTIPDGYLLSIKEKKWYIIEVELESHPLHEHIVAQISKFSTAIKNVISIEELKNAFYDEITRDPCKNITFQNNGINEIYKHISDIIKNTPEIIIFIDKRSIDLDDVCKDLPFYTRPIIFKTYCREGTGERIYQIDGLLKNEKENTVNNLDSINEPSIDLTSDFSDVLNGAMKNSLFEKLVKEIQNIDQSIEIQKPQKTMIGFYENGRGLAWVNYPNNKNKIIVHLRKAEYSKVEVPKDNFVAIGWGGYPEYSVNSENGIEYVIKLVKYVLEEDEASSPSKDYSRYKFVDNEYGKSRLVLAVIKEYLNKHNSTYQQLKGVFPDKVQGSRDVFGAVKDIKEKDFNRYFMKSDEKLKTSDNIEIAVCTQWGKFNIYKFIETVNSLDISKIEY